MAFNLTTHPIMIIAYTRGLAPLMNVIFRGRCNFQISFLDRDMSRSVWSRLLGSYMVITGILTNNMNSPFRNVTWHSGRLLYAVTRSIDQALHQFATLLLNWTLGEKGRDLTQSYDKSPYTSRNVKRTTWQHKQPHKKFDYTAVADRLRT